MQKKIVILNKRWKLLQLVQTAVIPLLSMVLPQVWNSLVPAALRITVHCILSINQANCLQEITNWENFHQVPEPIFGNMMPLHTIYSLWRVSDVEVNKILASKSSGSRLPISKEEWIQSMWREAIILLYLVLAVYVRRFTATRCLILGKKDVEVQQKTKMCPSGDDVIFILMKHASVTFI